MTTALAIRPKPVLWINRIQQPREIRVLSNVSRHPDYFPALVAVNMTGDNYRRIADISADELIPGIGQAVYVASIGYAAHEKRTRFILVDL